MSDDAPNKGRVHQHQVVFFFGGQYTDFAAFVSKAELTFIL